MARLLENIGKELLRQRNISVPRFAVAEHVDGAIKVAADIGYPVVVKGLVPAGKRGKAGAIRFADHEQAVGDATEAIIGSKIGPYTVNQVLVEEKLAIDAELFLSISIDAEQRCPVIVLGRQGGMDVETIALASPDSLLHWHVKPIDHFLPFRARELWSRLAVSSHLIRPLGDLLHQLYQTFLDLDATLIEVNPLAIVGKSQAVVAAVMMSIDDHALYRQPLLREHIQLGADRAWRPPTPLEERSMRLQEAGKSRGSSRYLELEGGNIGFLCGGGGASLVLFDGLVAEGGQLANYAEIGGNPTAEQVREMTEIVLSKPGVEALFVAHNITNNTQVDLVAEGVVQALNAKGLSGQTFPVVAREVGVGEERAAEIFKAGGCEYYGRDKTLAEAAAIMVKRMNAQEGMVP
ncbi:acetate--CoA ligase family protein [Chloroflexi bacterium TSY]|nr:acetate--CoA ligase family protein [Chloroflexi bacterium TSY]